MLTTTLLSKYLAKQKTEQEASRQKSSDSKKLNTRSMRAVSFDDEKAVANEPERLTSEQAKALVRRLVKEGAAISPWQIIIGQLLVGVVIAVAVGLSTGRLNVALSFGYGVFAVVLPAALFARGLTSQFSSLNALTAGFGFFVWEMIKIVATVVLIAMAPKLVANLDWLAMLIGLIVTMKVVFVLLWFLSKRAKDKSIS